MEVMCFVAKLVRIMDLNNHANKIGNTRWSKRIFGMADKMVKLERIFNINA